MEFWDQITSSAIDIKYFAKDGFDSLLTPLESSLILGMLFGLKSSIPAEFKSSLISTGTIHIVVVSGYNMTVLIGFVEKVFESLFFRVNRFLVFVAAILFLGFYVLIAGDTPPVLRAYIMSMTLLLGRILGRQRRVLWVLTLSGLILLVINPLLINDISFQFSYMATLGLILFENKIKKVFLYLLKKDNFIISGFSSTLAANVLIWPLISLYFGRVSILSPFVNVLVLWCVPYIMLLGGIIFGLMLLNLNLAQAFVPVIKALLAYFVFVISFFGEASFADISYRITPLSLFIYFLFVVAVLVFLMKDRGRKRSTSL